MSVMSQRQCQRDGPAGPVDSTSRSDCLSWPLSTRLPPGSKRPKLGLGSPALSASSARTCSKSVEGSSLNDATCCPPKFKHTSSKSPDSSTVACNVQSNLFFGVSSSIQFEQYRIAKILPSGSRTPPAHFKRPGNSPI